MKKVYLLATALALLVSCSDENYVGDKETQQASSSTPISFNMNTPAITRAEGSGAATKLNNLFIVWGEKNEDGGTAVTVPSANSVFPNYKVVYTANTAYTTTSNTMNWEYTGLDWSTGSTYVKMGGAAVPTTSQTIKYWDYAANSYTFTAVSAKLEDITSGKVTINKLTSGSTAYDKGYEVDVTNAADFTSLYFADRVKIGDEASDKTGHDRTAANKYGGNVKFTFRNAMSQVRVGMYETIPGYDVKVTSFLYVDNAAPTFETMTTSSTTNFAANVPNTPSGVAGKFTVKYYDNTVPSTENHPTISFVPTTSTEKRNYITLGNQITAATKLGETSTAATYDQTDGSDDDSEADYTSVFPQENNDKNLKLKINYQLKNNTTGETINITGKTAEVPAQYLQWKPNYKYTYLFKITDDDLYPITFDAVVVEAENGIAEYITTVTEPSITTYAKGSAVTANGEYKAGELIYAVVEDVSGLATLNATNMKLYTVTTTDATNFPITEASVAEAIAEYPTMSTAEQTAAKIKFTASSFTTYGKTLVAEDGSTVDMHATNNVVASFTGAAITSPSTAPQYYAIEYIKTPATYGNDGGKTYATSGAFTAAGKLYKEAACENVADADYYSSHKDDTYYKKTVTSVGEYAYKIVKVVP